MRRALATMVCGLGIGALVPVAAYADGNPVGPIVGGVGATAPGSAVDDVAVSAGNNTVVEQVQRADARVGNFTLLRGTYGVPGVGYGGAGTGLSADRRTLVLERYAGGAPEQRTTLAVLNGRSLRVRTHISFPGYFTVDAVSPGGRWLYLTHYRSFSDVNHYEVRVYDLVAHKLLARPIVDPREPDEKMQGTPMTRVVSPDGRWDYTLYYRYSDAPFIHALDTTGRRAFCIDLPRRLNRQIGMVRLMLARGTLRVSNQRGMTLATVNTRTLNGRRAFSVARAGFPWLPAAIGVAAVAAVGLAVRRRHTGSSATSRWTSAA